MKKTTAFAGLVLLFFCVWFFFACNSTSTEPTAGEEPAAQTISFEEYVGTYDIIETKDNRRCKVFIENDSLYLHSDDIGQSLMYAERNEVFDVPGHETRMRFLRDKSGEVNRVVILTKRGRFTGMKVL